MGDGVTKRNDREKSKKPQRASRVKSINLAKTEEKNATKGDDVSQKKGRRRGSSRHAKKK